MSVGLYGQVDLNMELVSRVDAFEGSNDVWGFQHSNGTEFAILGTRSSTKVYSLDNPVTPALRAVIPGPTTTWRDIKTFNDYAYVTTDGTSPGLTILDITDPDNIESHIWDPPLWIGNSVDSLKECHNLYIDDDGFGYLAGCNISVGGIIILDLFTDPLNPTMVGYADQSYSHDVFTKGDRMYTSEIFEGWFAIYDISDKSNPTRIATQTTGTEFTHNAWTSPDENFIFTTDERPNAYVEAYDISDPQDIKMLDRYRPAVTEGNGVIPHNTHYLDGFLITSWYSDGVVVIDANKPDNLIKVAGYDTWLGADGGSNGCWGAFPYLPSGLILASDRTSGLHVLNPSYERACYLEGNVVSAGTGLAISGATLTIVSQEQLAETNSDASGDYKTGIANAGTYEVLVTHPEFEDLIATVELINGEVTILNVEMIKPNSSVFTSSVVRDADDQPVPNALMKLVHPNGDIDDIVADENGNSLLELTEGVYTIYASQWGFKIGEFEFDTETDPILEVRLEQGYRDEFFFDHGWAFDGDADEGSFEIGVPEEVVVGDFLVNIDFDNQEDLGTEALLTGAGINHPIHLDYVKNGRATATTPPMNLNDFDFPVIKFDLFFLHDGIIGPGTYSLDIILNRGNEQRILRQFDMTDTTWTSIELHPKEAFWDLTDVSVSYTVFNDMDGIFTEVAIDVFEVVEGSPSSIQEFTETELLIYPNPSQDVFQISLESLDFDEYQLTTVNGQVIQSDNILDLNFTIDGSALLPGVYFLQLSSDESISRAYRIIKQ